MDEPDYPNRLTHAEAEIVEIIRLAHMPEFDLTISHQGGVFTVKLTDITAGRLVEEQGRTLSSAWAAIAPGLESRLPSLSEKLAARGLRVIEGED